MSADGLSLWLDLAQRHDRAGIPAILAEDVVFHSPVVHTPQRGRAIAARYLAGAMDVLDNGAFAYVGTWRGDRSGVLEFRTEIEGIVIEGVDMIAWDEAGAITAFKVMIRPLKAINLVHRLMAERLAAAT